MNDNSSVSSSSHGSMPQLLQAAAVVQKQKQFVCPHTCHPECMEREFDKACSLARHLQPPHLHPNHNDAACPGRPYQSKQTNDERNRRRREARQRARDAHAFEEYVRRTEPYRAVDLRAWAGRHKGNESLATCKRSKDDLVRTMYQRGIPLPGSIDARMDSSSEEEDDDDEDYKPTTKPKAAAPVQATLPVPILPPQAPPLVRQLSALPPPPPPVGMPSREDVVKQLHLAVEAMLKRAQVAQQTQSDTLGRFGIYPLPSEPLLARTMFLGHMTNVLKWKHIVDLADPAKLTFSL